MDKNSSETGDYSAQEPSPASSKASSHGAELSNSSSSRSSSTSCHSQATTSASATRRSDTTPRKSSTRGPAQRLRSQSTSSARLNKPFRSPLSRIPVSTPDFSPSTPRQTLSNVHRGTTSPRSVSMKTARAERQELEARLLLLQQAERCLQLESLRTLPESICKWKQAGQIAAEDLWTLTGSSFADSMTPSHALKGERGDYGLESQPTSSQEGKAANKRRRIDSSPPAPSGPVLLRRFDRASPGTQEQASALRSHLSDSADRPASDGSSDFSLPDVSELIRRSQSKQIGYRARKQPLTTLSQSWSADPDSHAASEEPDGKGIENKWNVGGMLDLLGADKNALGWNVDEEGFDR